ncbi:MAG: hypothetical protein CL563_04390 [Alphaproteobacteria bacterium]|nr:hypothetical protein [Alphaproteobacteria bacterium]
MFGHRCSKRALLAINGIANDLLRCCVIDMKATEYFNGLTDQHCSALSIERKIIGNKRKAIIEEFAPAGFRGSRNVCCKICKTL